MSVSSLDKIHAYRHLYRCLLHAVQYSKPARYTARDQLRDAFRKEDPANFSKEKVERTVEFLNIAAREKGLEHHLVKTLILTAYWRRRNLARPPVQIRTDVQFELSRTARTHYDMTLAMLNDTMGLCLRNNTLSVSHNCTLCQTMAEALLLDWELFLMNDADLLLTMWRLHLEQVGIVGSWFYYAIMGESFKLNYGKVILPKN